MSGPSRAHRQLWFLALRASLVRRLPGRYEAALSLASALVFTSAFGCGTKASGIEECRQIELARCRSGELCGLIEDAQACERYVEDHCLHGFDPALGPSKAEVLECSEAIEDVGACAQRSGTKTNPDVCRETSLRKANASRVCDLVERPERIPSCEFLAPTSSRNEDSGAGRPAPDPDEDENESTADLDAGAPDAGE